MSKFWANQGVGALVTINQIGDRFHWGTSDPEGAVEAPQGSIYLRTDGGNDTTLYVKTSGDGTTGWRRVSTSSLL